jgi:hypothetical protein
MMERISSTAERLELLSNTAMLKKVLDKKYPADEVSAFSRDAKPQTPIAPIQAPPASPKSLLSERSQGRDSISPHHGVVEPTRDSPPYARGDPSRHQQDYHHYNGASFGYPTGSHYPPFPPVSHRGYMHGSHMDRYYLENHAQGPMGPLAPHPEQGRSHAQYTVKENVAPFRSPYHDRQMSGSHHQHHMPGTDSSSRSPKFFSPAISVSEDCEDSSVPQSNNRVSYEALLRENYHMRDQLQDKDSVISSLQHKVDQLETQIAELRQLPTGKISHIPVE